MSRALLALSRQIKGHEGKQRGAVCIVRQRHRIVNRLLPMVLCLRTGVIKSTAALYSLLDAREQARVAP